MKEVNFLYRWFLRAVVIFVIISSGRILAQNDTMTIIAVDTLESKEDLFSKNKENKEIFDTLSSDGDWIELSAIDFVKDVYADYEPDESDFGGIQTIYCWRPRNMGLWWNPYWNGYWAFSNAGWCWRSNYSWGWATYNYGRWVYSPYYGWLWIPGRIWGPNWVYWRICNGYYGWYPMFPWWGRWGHHHHGYRTHNNNWVFVEKKDFTKEITKEVVIDKDQVNEVIRNSTPLTKVNKNGESGIYKGPEVNNIKEETGTKIPFVNVVRSSESKDKQKGYIGNKDSRQKTIKEDNEAIKNPESGEKEKIKKDPTKDKKKEGEVKNDKPADKPKKPIEKEKRRHDTGKEKKEKVEPPKNDTESKKIESRKKNKVPSSREKNNNNESRNHNQNNNGNNSNNTKSGSNSRK